VFGLSLASRPFRRRCWTWCNGRAIMFAVNVEVKIR
jgi:hypothetical protein